MKLLLQLIPQTSQESIFKLRQSLSVHGLGDDQKIYCWGYGGLSGLGDGSTTNNPIPTEINDTAIGNPSWRYVWSGKIWFVGLMMLSVVLLQMECLLLGREWFWPYGEQ